MNDDYKNYLSRVDLIKNQVERERLREQQVQQTRKQRMRKQLLEKQQQILQAELTSRMFASVYSTGGDSSVDADAQAFITSAAITDPTQQSAVNQLVVDLKGYGIWTKMNFIYPFVGGTASTHKWNLKNPLDTDAAFRLLFSGGVTHSTNGVQFGGVNGWAETYLNPNTVFNTNDSFHLSIYSRTNSASNSAYEMGGQNGSTRTALLLRSALGNVFNYAHLNGIVTANPNSTGMYVSTRETSTSLKLFRNNVQLGSTYTGANGARFDLTLPIGAYKIGVNPPSNFSNRQYAFASIGDGLTDTEAANLYTAVQAFQTTLGRNI
jgi:hypothetical protein